MPTSAERAPVVPLMIAWVAEGKRALLVGGGGVSTRRARALLAAGAELHVVAPELSSALDALHAAGVLTWTSRCFRSTDLDGADLVLVAIDDPSSSARICELARQRRIPVHVADEPGLCDFYFAAVGRRGPVQIAVSTAGRGPVLAGRLRDLLMDRLPPRVEDAVERFGALRAATRIAASGIRDPTARMHWLRDLGRRLGWGDLAVLTDEEIRCLVDEGVGARSPL